MPENKPFVAYKNTALTGDSQRDIPYRWAWDTPTQQPHSYAATRTEAQAAAELARSHWVEALTWAQSFNSEYIRTFAEELADVGSQTK